MTPTKCILCNIEGHSYGQKNDYNKYTSEDPSGKSYGVRRVYNFLVCPQCGLFWVKDPDENYADFYKSEEYWWDYHKRRGWNSLDEQPRIDNDLKYSKLRIPTIKQFIQSGSVLEIGSSTGTMLKELKDNGFSPIIGVEPNEHVRAQARSYSGCVMLEDSSQAKDNDFDFVVALDVLEHLENPMKECKLWVDKLKNNGIIMLELPDSGCEHALNQGIEWEYVIPMEHTYYYRKDHVERLFNIFGCSLINVSNPWTTDRMRFFFRKVF